MLWLGIVILFLIACFSFVLFVGPPYLPTLNKQVVAALDLMDLQPGETLLELGCGDGKVLVAAARRGLNVVGYELNPLLAMLSWLRTRRYRRQVRVIWGNFWARPWPAADGIFVFLLPRLTAKLHTKVMQYPHKPVKLVSFAFSIKAKQPTAERAGVYLYEY
jgi:16S rRNA A1518/A1519 N6-dimethyltransferase RsmA/KsgA/DIM1 with predicted DNA glycosylase/AP lyase activity